MLDFFAGFVRFALVIGLTAISVAAQTAAVLPTQAPGVSGATAQASSGPPQRLAPTYATSDVPACAWQNELRPSAGSTCRDAGRRNGRI
jgi:hypothetical protein